MSIFVSDQDRNAHAPDELLLKFLRRLLLWSIICAASAVPSFFWAAGRFDRSAMVCGVVLFIAVYTALSLTQAFERFHDWPHVRTTLYTGYLVRLALALAFPLGMGADLLPGLISVNIARNIVGLPEGSFLTTFVATVVQGGILNCILFVFMLIVYAILRARGRSQTQPRGFDVLIPEARQAPPQS